jgi:hypothetical protein
MDVEEEDGEQSGCKGDVEGVEDAVVAPSAYRFKGSGANGDERNDSYQTAYYVELS